MLEGLDRNGYGLLSLGRGCRRLRPVRAVALSDLGERLAEAQPASQVGLGTRRDPRLPDAQNVDRRAAGLQLLDRRFALRGEFVIEPLGFLGPGRQAGLYNLPTARAGA